MTTNILQSALLAAGVEITALRTCVCLVGPAVVAIFSRRRWFAHASGNARVVWQLSPRAVLRTFGITMGGKQ